MSDSPESTLDTRQKKKDNPQPRPTPPPKAATPSTHPPQPRSPAAARHKAQKGRSYPPHPSITQARRHAGTQARTRRSQHISCFITLFFFLHRTGPMQPPKLCSASAACTDKPPALAQPACAPGIRNVSRSVCAWTSVVGRWHGTGSKQGEGLGREKANCCCCAAAFLQCSCPL